MELAVITTEGKDTGRKVSLPKEIFGEESNNHAVYLDVKQYLAHQRQGTHKSKERSEIVGSTRKIKKQKGTGTARAGSIKNPLFVGGGRVFGPRPRKYTQKLNKNLKKIARKSALSIKAKEKSIVVIEDFSFEVPKTSQFVKILKNLSLDDKKSLFVLENQNNNVYLASRNLKKSSVLVASDINTYSILNANKLVFSESSLGVLQEMFK